MNFEIFEFEVNELVNRVKKHLNFAAFGVAVAVLKINISPVQKNLSNI